MRIIAGKFRRRLLTSPPDSTRPMRDRVREAVFSMLEHCLDFDDLRVLDLFAGSGSLSIESLSRGAKRATLVEQQPVAVDAIGQSARMLNIEQSIEVVASDVFSFVSKMIGSPGSQIFDLVFLDPPFAMDSRTILQPLAKMSCLRAGSVIVLHSDAVNRSQLSDYSAETVLSDMSWQFTLLKQKTYGRSLVTVFESVQAEMKDAADS